MLNRSANRAPANGPLHPAYNAPSNRRCTERITRGWNSTIQGPSSPCGPRSSEPASHCSRLRQRLLAFFGCDSEPDSQRVSAPPPSREKQVTTTTTTTYTVTVEVSRSGGHYTTAATEHGRRDASPAPLAAGGRPLQPSLPHVWNAGTGAGARADEWRRAIGNSPRRSNNPRGCAQRWEQDGSARTWFYEGLLRTEPTDL